MYGLLESTVIDLMMQKNQFCAEYSSLVDVDFTLEVFLEINVETRGSFAVLNA